MTMAPSEPTTADGERATPAPEPTGGGPELRCPACSATVLAGDRFCEACGGRLDLQLIGTAPESGPAAGARTCPQCGGTAISADGYCEGCGQRQPKERDRVERDLGIVAGVSDKGRRHHRNEDAMAFGHTLGPDGAVGVAVVVSDGVSTTDRPDEASQVAVDAAGAVLLDALRAGGDATTATRAAAVAAGEVVAALGEQGTSTMAPSCTYVSALVTATTVTVGSVGDSRAYWLGVDGSASCLSADDSWAGQMVASGQLDAGVAYTDRRAHTILAWLGRDAPEVNPHVSSIEPAGPGVVLVCSDGLWNYLWESNALAAAVLPGGLTAPLSAARRLTQLALDAGGHDNITVVAVPFPPGAEHAPGAGAGAVDPTETAGTAVTEDAAAADVPRTAEPS